MTTATKTPTTAPAQLRKLERAKDKAHAAVHEVKRKRDAWDAETQAKRIELTQRRTTHPEEFEGPSAIAKPETAAGNLRGEIKERMSAENPHADEYEVALAAFHGHDRAVQRFRRDHVQELVDDAVGDADPDAIREALEALGEACQPYLAGCEAGRAEVIATPALTGQDFGFDPRVREIYEFSQRAVEDELIRPGLAPWALDKLAKTEIPDD